MKPELTNMILSPSSPSSPRRTSRRATPRLPRTTPARHASKTPCPTTSCPRCHLTGSLHIIINLCFLLNQHHQRGKSSTCKHIPHNLPCRPRTHPASRRRKRRRHPAEKPVDQQWCLAHAIPGVFVCGRCKKPFVARHLAKRHRRSCEDSLQ